ncbi:MAG: pyridoxamine 5'-phosphate oxidase family protein [Phormidesmis sp.]
MVNPGWTNPESPFHKGELAIQAHVGAKERIDQQGRRMIRAYLTDQHRQFFTQLSYVIIGAVDSSGSPWASILTGDPGFLSSPDDHTLRVCVLPAVGDPLAAILASSGGKTDIGVLGIELQSRRRNRLNGVISSVDASSFEIRVSQSFGNCPQYIQARQAYPAKTDPAVAQAVENMVTFSSSAQAIISAADTFFIATAYQAKSAGAASGIDVSHRGGKPDFVQIENNTLTIPDFAGNNHFNTLGNIVLNPRVGLLFIDFDGGDLLHLTGTAEIIWEGPEVENYKGAQRLLRFHLTQGYWIKERLSLRWSDPELSPFL